MCGGGKLHYAPQINHWFVACWAASAGARTGHVWFVFGHHLAAEHKVVPVIKQFGSYPTQPRRRICAR